MSFRIHGGQPEHEKACRGKLRDPGRRHAGARRPQRGSRSNDEIAAALNTRPKFVASRTLDKVTWNNSHLLKGDVAEEVAKLKLQEGGEIQVHGSSDLLQTLLRHDLIDALRIWRFPVVVGAGKRLFGEGTVPGSFRPVDTQETATGA